MSRRAATLWNSGARPVTIAVLSRQKAGRCCALGATVSGEITSYSAGVASWMRSTWRRSSRWAKLRSRCVLAAGCPQPEHRWGAERNYPTNQSACLSSIQRSAHRSPKRTSSHLLPASIAPEYNVESGHHMEERCEVVDDKNGWNRHHAMRALNTYQESLQVCTHTLQLELFSPLSVEPKHLFVNSWTQG